MNSSELKEIISTYEIFLSKLILEPQLFRIKTVEMDLKGPLNPTNDLNTLFFIEKNWLGFQDFLNYYVKKYSEPLKKLCGVADWEKFKSGLKARLYRTQFGFLTEYHAFFIAKLVFGDDNVKRNTDLDKIGVDFQIFYLGKTFNIHIFVDTDRAWYYRRFKTNFKSVEQKEGSHVNLPYNLQQGYINSLRFLPNGFGVYTKDYLEYLKSQIDTGKIGNNNISAVGENGFKYD